MYLCESEPGLIGHFQVEKSVESLVSLASLASCYLTLIRANPKVLVPSNSRGTRKPFSKLRDVAKEETNLHVIGKVWEWVGNVAAALGGKRVSRPRRPARVWI